MPPSRGRERPGRLPEALYLTVVHKHFHEYVQRAHGNAETAAGLSPFTEISGGVRKTTAGPACREKRAAHAAPAEQEAGVPHASEHLAYEEYLKDCNEPVNMFQAETVEETAQIEDLAAAQDPAADIDPSGELRIEMDTKNAHVWNELGNVYFNTGAFDDAVLAYSRAIDLDRWFAWPYSNLALAYVQKNRFAEAILLYQRSIELFASDKDKAITWNRLGNVYRRMNDYDNAIVAYQRADDLDPDSTALSLQSRFSLLGSYAMEPKPSYAS